MDIIIRTVICFILTSKVQSQLLHNEKQCNDNTDAVVALQRVEIKLQTLENEMKNRLQKLEDQKTELLLKVQYQEAHLHQLEIELNSTKHELELQEHIVTENSSQIAFYAYMSGDVYPSRSQILKFDVVKTNIGGGYHLKTGEFTAPRDGLYVFTWVVRMYSAEHSTELIVNNQVYGASFLRAKLGDDGSVSNTAIAFAKRGQKVFVRNHLSLAGDGRIHSNLHGRPTFSGFLLK